MSQRRPLKPEKTPDCSEEKWFWEISRSSRLLRLDSPVLPREEMLFCDRRRKTVSWFNRARIGARERSPREEQSVVLP